MKVELNSATLASIGTLQNNKAEATSANANPAIEGPDQDKTTLSTDSTSVGALTTAALSSPEVRQDKIDALRTAIQNGTYQVDPQKIAEAMIRD